MKERSVLLKVLIVLVVLGMFLGYLQYDNYQKRHFQVNTKTFSALPSMSDYMEKEYTKISFLKVADQYNQISNTNQIIRLPKFNRDLEFNKVWLTDQGLYLMYSFNILKTDSSLKDIPKLVINHAELNMSNNDNLKINQLVPTVESHHAIDKRIYHTVLFKFINYLPFQNALFDSRKDNRDEILNDLKQVNSITLNDIECSVNKANIKLDPVSLKTKYTSSTKTLKKIPINKELSFKNGTIKLLDAEMTLQGIFMNLNVKSKDNIRFLNFEETNNNGISMNRIASTSNKQLYLGLPNKWPVQINLTPVGYITKKDRHFEAKISKETLKKMASSKKDISEIKIGTIEGTSIYFGIDKNAVLLLKNINSVGFYLRPTVPHAAEGLDWNRVILKRPKVKYGNYSNFSFLEILKHDDTEFNDINEIGVVDDKRYFSLSKEEWNSNDGIHLSVAPLFINHPLKNQESIKITLK